MSERETRRETAREQRRVTRRGTGVRAWLGRSRILTGAGVVALMAAAGVAGAWSGAAPAVDAAAHADAQDIEEAVMVAAGEWVLDRIPSGRTQLDPHRSGAGKDGARVSRVAQALGARLGTLDEARQCTDTMNPATCELGVDRLLAIAAPQIDGDEARVKVYAWYRSSSPPVAQRNWNLVLRQSGGDWRVVSGG